MKKFFVSLLICLAAVSAFAGGIEFFASVNPYGVCIKDAEGERLQYNGGLSLGFDIPVKKGFFLGSRTAMEYSLLDADVKEIDRLMPEFVAGYSFAASDKLFINGFVTLGASVTWARGRAQMPDFKELLDIGFTSAFEVETQYYVSKTVGFSLGLGTRFVSVEKDDHVATGFCNLGLSFYFGK